MLSRGARVDVVECVITASMESRLPCHAAAFRRPGGALLNGGLAAVEETTAHSICFLAREGVPPGLNGKTLLQLFGGLGHPAL